MTYNLRDLQTLWWRFCAACRVQRGSEWDSKFWRKGLICAARIGAWKCWLPILRKTLGFRIRTCSTKQQTKHSFQCKFKEVFNEIVLSNLVLQLDQLILQCWLQRKGHHHEAPQEYSALQHVDYDTPTPTARPLQQRLMFLVT